MIERRMHARQQLDTRVRLYHPEFGSLDGVCLDMSDGGIFIRLDEVPSVHPGNGNSRFQCGFRNMDVVFDACCVRSTEQGLALAFIEPDEDPAV
ncbi:MAG TPA: PilZ domain-containing protein, partial [Chromatiales bacterium]|nr:PilZ domain-containing protein [Chromatiales bacterium]